MSRPHPLTAFVLVYAAIGVVVACSGPSKGALTTKASTRATPASFRENGVSTVFEKRCGSLDCHGSIARNMRIYSSGGLRLENDAGNVPGAGDTTIDEINANFYSVTLLEPEKMNDVIAGGDPEGLLLLRKPLGVERHKGGTQLLRGDDAYKCIYSWLVENPVDPTTQINKTACTNAANNFPMPAPTM
jgi:hypothetical protein